jgi:hypothetical protein
VILKIDFKKAYENICWGFVEEVLERKGFSTLLRNWIMSTIRGGRFALTSMARMGCILRHIGG